ncbi:transposase [Neoasaia chiangmaiensis]|uniref:transposase n=1 Tax=Neoasaia chiangmaiensis TaxID=320497 RepID=UPI001FE893EB|nr:transposase [Neoasaia chiangmaiensis]
MHGFKANVGADATTALVERIAITPANINDGRAGPDVVPADPGEVFADSAYRDNHLRDAVRSKGGTLRVTATSMWGRDEQETLARLKAWNDTVQIHVTAIASQSQTDHHDPRIGRVTGRRPHPSRKAPCQRAKTWRQREIMPCFPHQIQTTLAISTTRAQVS